MPVMIDMKMPESCGRCAFYSGYDDFCVLTERQTTESFLRRPDFCPLVELRRNQSGDMWVEC